jgi:hypothetical protein
MPVSLTYLCLAFAFLLQNEPLKKTLHLCYSLLENGEIRFELPYYTPYNLPNQKQAITFHYFE